MPMTGFICQDVYLSKLAKLSDQEVGRLMRALMQYHASGEEPELTGRESVAFDFIKDDIDRAEAAYQAKCNKNRQNRATTSDDGYERPSTNDNERERPSTNDNERPQNININKNKKEIENNIDTISCPTSGADKARETREMEARFTRFWTAYPKHSAKQNALKAFQKLKPDDDLLDTMIAAIEKQRTSPQWTRDGGQYIPMPSTWINGRRWEDEVTVAPASAQSALRQVNAQMCQQREYADSDEMPEWLKRRIDAELAKAGEEAACTSA